jgi:hypothetical protein
VLNAAVLTDAEPALNAAVPNDVAPSKNSTVPVGTPANDTTPAVNVTDAPCTGLAGTAVTPVAVSARPTVWVTAAEVLFPNVFASADVNTAVIWWSPPVRVDTTNWATPVASTVTGTPNEVGPSKNSTVPAGIPVAGATADTVAANVTGLENTDGFGELATTVDEPAVVTV